MSVDTKQLTGFDDLFKNLAELDQSTSNKVLRSAAMSSTTAVVRKLRAKAPKGSRAHRTYKGRLVAPGFLSRNIRRRSFISRRNGTANVELGVSKEAFYGLFYDQGFKRGKGGSGAQVAGSRWLSDTFTDSRGEIEISLVEQLRKRIDKIRAKNR